MSYFQGFKYFANFWFLLAPVATALFFTTLPLKLFRSRSKKPSKIEVEITEAKGSREKDEILLIHGYPDCARMWDKQVEFLSANGYRCINLTLPNFGKEENRGSWGYSFPQINEMLAEVVEKHSKQKKVSLLIHDWGSAYGFNLTMHRPDLVKRIAALDVGGHLEITGPFVIFLLSYQMFLVLLFLFGDPVGTWFH